MPDLQKGYTFSGASPNNSVTAEKLNSLVDSATILPDFYTGKTENAVAGSTDYALLYDSTNAEYRKMQVGNLVPTARARTGVANLYAATTSGTAVAAQADEVLMRSDAGGLFYVHGFSATADITVYSGASTVSGRDSTNADPNTWFYLWAIGDGSNARLLFSKSASSPTLPAGYAYKALLGAARCNATSTLVRFVQRNMDVAVDLAGPAGTATSTLNPYTGATPVEFTNVAPAATRTLQTVDLSRCVPPGITGRARGLIGCTDPAAVTCVYALCPEGTSSLASGALETLEGLQLYSTPGVGAGSSMLGFCNAAAFDVVVKTSQQLSWTCSYSAAKHSMRITGYRLAL